jgi:hypothetical protein
MTQAGGGTQVVECLPGALSSNPTTTIKKKKHGIYRQEIAILEHDI